MDREKEKSVKNRLFTRLAQKVWRLSLYIGGRQIIQKIVLPSETPINKGVSSDFSTAQNPKIGKNGSSTS
jgi:hypothetical protein